jgi:eukaryotic-like serine/threonine-protein kinase
MLLLCWAATFGSDRELDASLGEVREEVDEAAGSLWTAPARENLGNMYYRGVELLRIGKSRSAERARNLLRAASQAYRETVNHDVLPVALGMWARAELLCGDRDGAARLANEAAELLESGAPSLLNESIVYLVLHDAEVERGNLEAAQAAVRRGMPALLRRTRGLATTPYVNSFLTELADNATLVAHTEQYGVLPEKLREVLGRDAG